MELTLSGFAHDSATTSEQPVVALRRRSIDQVLVAAGTLVAIVLVVAGSLLTWGSRFATDYVHDELASQHVAFPDAAALTAEGRTDLLDRAGQQVTSGAAAQDYASYIAHHLDTIGGGSTYADLGAPEAAAKAAVQAAKDAGAPTDEIASLQAKADGITATRNTLFKGETLRGLLLTSFAWATVGKIAGIAAAAAFVAAVAMAALVVAGVVHLRRAARR